MAFVKHIQLLYKFSSQLALHKCLAGPTPKKPFLLRAGFTLKDYPRRVYVSVGITSDPLTRHKVITGRKEANKM